MKVCQKCLLNSNYRNIKFNSFGICNYCQTYERVRACLTDFDNNKKLLEERLNLIRGKYQYDCLIGISGGKDSSYLAYQLKVKHGLKILAFTFDNGFLTDYAKRNIELVVKKLNLDHFFFKPNWDTLKEFYCQAIIHFGYPCPACAYSSYASMNKLAFEGKIPFCIHGRSRAQMFKELLDNSIDPFLPFIKNNLSAYSIQRNKETAINVLNRLNLLLKKVIIDKNLREKFYKEFFPDMEEYKQSDLVPEFLGYFLYEKYDEKKVIETLVKELNWSAPSDLKILSHHDCSVHDAAMYLYNKVLGYSLLSLELSVMVREGDISRKEALKRAENEEFLSKLPNDSLDILCSRCNIGKDVINKVIFKTRWSHKLLKYKLRFKNILYKGKFEI